MRSYFQFVLKHRLLVALVLALLTGLAGASASRAHLSSTIKKLFFGDAPEYAAYVERVQAFGNDQFFVVAYAADQPMDPVLLDRLDALSQTLEADPSFARVQGPHTAQRVWSEDGALRVERYADLVRGGMPAAEATALLQADPDLGGLVMGWDGRSGAVLLELQQDETRGAEQAFDLVPSTLATFEAAGFARSDLHVVGFPALVSGMTAIAYDQLSTLFPLTGLVLLVVVWALFRRLGPVAVTMGVSAISVLWTLGFAAMLDRQFSIFTTLVPGIVMIVAFSDVVHLWNAYLTELAAGRSKREAILESATDVGRACFWTSLTTFVGFVGLSLVPTPMMRLLGLTLGFGVGVALLLAMTIVPIWLSFMAAPAPAQVRRPGRVAAAVDGLVGWCHRVSTQRPWWVIGAFALFLAWAMAGAAQLKVETDFSERIDEGHEIRQDMDWFAERFSGTTVVDLFVDTPAPDGVTDAAVFAGVAQLEQELEARPDVDEVVGLVDLIRRMHTELGGEGPLPETQAGIAQYLLLFEMAGGEDLDRTVDFERQTLRLVVRTSGMGVRAAEDLAIFAEDRAAAILGQTATVEGTGLVPLFGWWLDRIVAGQQRALLGSTVVIALMMLITLRSLRAGLWSMIPNLLPLIAFGGVLGWFCEDVDSDAAIVALMAIGIGVDDTIHFLVRLRLESARCDTVVEALERTFRFAGRSIVMTTVILAGGFLPYALSHYWTTWLLGTALPAVLVTALVADLLLVPALARVGWIRFR